MNATVIRWKLGEVMARYQISGRAMAKELDVSDNMISIWRKATKLPNFKGDRLNDIYQAILKLGADDAQNIQPLSTLDLLEWVPDEGGDDD